MIQNRNINRQWESLFLPWQAFSSTQKVVSVGDGGGTNVTSSQANFVQAANVAENVNSKGISGLKINTASHAVRHLTTVPWNLDSTSPVYFRVYWTSGSSNTADTITWKVFHQDVTPNSELITASIARPLTTVIPQDTTPVAAAYTLCRTNKGTLTPPNTAVTSGVNGVTTSASATTHTFTSAGATFSATGVITGDLLTLSGTQYVVVSASTTTLVFAKRDGSSFNPGAATAIPYTIRHPGISAGQAVELEVELDAFTEAAPVDKFFLGLEVLYAPLISVEGGAPMPDVPSDWV